MHRIALLAIIASSGHAAATGSSRVLGAVAGIAAVAGIGADGAGGGHDEWGPTVYGAEGGVDNNDGNQTCADIVAHISCTDPCVMHLGMDNVSSRNSYTLGHEAY